MADNEYKIRLGVEVDTNGITKQINDKIKPDPIKIDFDIKGAEEKIKSLKKQLSELSKPIDVPVNTTAKTNRSGIQSSPSATSKKQVDETAVAYKKLISLQREMSKLRVDQSILEIKGGNDKQIEKITARLKELRREYADTAATMKTPLDNTQKESLALIYDNASRKIEDFRARYTGAMSDASKKTYELIANADKKAARGIQIKLETNGFDSELSKIDESFSKLKNPSRELVYDIELAKDKFEEMQSIITRSNSLYPEDFYGKGYLDPDSINALIQKNKEYNATIEKINNSLRIQSIEQKAIIESQKLRDDRSIFQLKIDSWLKKNSAATKSFGMQLQSLKAQAEKCDRTTLGHLEKEFKKIDLQAEKAGLKMQSFGDRLRTKFKEYSSYLSVASLFMYGTQALRAMFEQVKLIDSAMTELKKVTNETDESYNKFLRDAASRAKELGTTIDGIVASTADFARLGYGFKDSQGLAEVANIYAVVGDEINGVEGATESLISTLAAFKGEMGNMNDSDFALSIVDKFNEVSNNFAISSGGIGEAMKRSASSLEAANNTIDESIALITAANEVVNLCHAM